MVIVEYNKQINNKKVITTSWNNKNNSKREREYNIGRSYNNKKQE